MQSLIHGQKVLSTGMGFLDEGLQKTCAAFQRMKISQQVYEGVKPSKTPIRAYTNRESLVRKCKRGESASPNKLKKSHDGKRRIKIQAIQSMCWTVLKRHACCISPETTQISVKYVRFIPIITPHRSRIKIKKPDLASNLSLINPPSSEITHRNFT